MGRRGDLTIIEVDSGTRTTVDTAGTDVTSLQWIDAARLGYLGQRHLDSVAGILDVTAGQVRELFSTECACVGSGFDFLTRVIGWFETHMPAGKKT